MDEKYVTPSFGASDFHCPHCGIHAHQHWYERVNGANPKNNSTKYWGGLIFNIPDLSISICNNCRNFALWLKDSMIFPKSSAAPLPNDDMPVDVKRDFVEARNIVNISPRASAALLRLALQELMLYLGESGKNINNDIGNLVKKGLPERLQKAADTVRVIGNNAVHPGEIDLRDDVSTAIALFHLLNMIVDVMITQPKEIDRLYEKIPNLQKDAIEKRDSNT
jgi:hypothetical protein